MRVFSSSAHVSLLMLLRALKNIQGGKISLTADALPAFLWAGDVPGKYYDDDNMFEGMFDGYLLERVGVVFFGIVLD